MSTLIIALVVVLIMLTFWCTYEVAFHEVAVKTRFGKPVAVIEEPGFRFRWPLAEDVKHYDRRLQTLSTPESESKTRDGKNIILGAYAVWTIADPLKFQTSIGEVRKAEDQMRSRLTQVQGTVIGESSLSEFVSLDPAQVNANHERLLRLFEDRVRPDLARDYGIKLHKIGFTRISLPKETTQQVFESMKQERNALAARYEQEGTARAEAIKARARAAEDSILAFVDRRAKEIESAGIQAATRILAQIPEQDRDFFEWLRWLDTLKAVFAQKTTVFIDEQFPGRLFETFARPPAAAGAAATQPAGR
ncbi:MAG: protease modulator HflC [Planctomycetota bacterium]